jgi:hypothetical protein
VKLHVDRVGRDLAPVIVIDDAWADARGLFEHAAARTDYGASSLYYPGVRCAAPREYGQGIVDSLSEVIRRELGVAGELRITDCVISLVTTPPGKLVPFQRVPHYDSTDPNRIALLHYLCDRGGTSFYRHRSSGTETVTASGEQDYILAVNAEVRASGMPPPAYVDGDTGLFERIGRYEAAFNRVLIYRGSMLHSVNVPADFVPDPDPRTGRLSVNTFLLAT